MMVASDTITANILDIIEQQKRKIIQIEVERDKWRKAYQVSQRQNKVLGEALNKHQ